MQPERMAMVPPPSPSADDLYAEIERRVGGRNFEHWFRDRTTLTITGDELTVGVGSPFLLNWMQKQFRPTVTAAAQMLLGPSARVRFDVDGRVSFAPDAAPVPHASPRPKNESDENGKHDRKDGEEGKPGRTAARNGQTASAGATPARNGRRFADLADFIEGACNGLPLMAARQVGDAPGARFNPLFLHGGVGTGKTHLLEGVYRRIRRQFPALQVMFLTAEAFANYFTQALREHTLPSFRQRFRSLDVLLVDDIDFLDSKRVIQEEFLHTFKQLESHGRQIVLTADRHPRLLSKVSDELMTRCLAGLVCRLEAPDLETRQKIVEHKAARLEAEFSPEALAFVAQRFKSNVRELEGALNCLATCHAMTGRRVGLTAARQVLADLERDCIRIVRMSDVEQVVCQFFGVEASELRSSRRHRSVSQPRMLAMFLARKHTQAAYSEIGHYFGGRNHSTVMSAERKVLSWLSDQTPIRIASQTWTFDDVLETLEQQLHAG